MEFDDYSKKTLEDHGFQLYKKKQYIKINNDVVFYLSFQGRKKDIYLWYATYPLCLPNLGFGSGWGQCAGRLPKVENELSILSDSDIPETSNKLLNLLESEYFQLIDQISSLEDITDMLLPSYVSSFSSLALGNYEKGIKMLKDYKVWKESISEYSTADDDVIYFLENSTAENIKVLLDIERKNNIKKLRLAKFIKDFDSHEN